MINVKVLDNLTIKNLKLNKKRTIVTIIGIILSVALISAVASMFFSCRQSLIEYESKRSGNFHYAFYDVKDSEIENFKLNRKIANIYTSANIGYAKLDGIKNEYKPYVFVKAFDTPALENLGIALIKGRMPENSNEIVIPNHLMTNGKVVELNIGDTITLDIGNRVSNGTILTQSNPFDTTNSEELIDTQTYTYKIVGVISRPSKYIESYEAPGYTFITYLDNNITPKMVDVYVRYTKDGIKNPYKVTAGILGVDASLYEKLYNPQDSISESEMVSLQTMLDNAEYQYNINDYLISLESGIIGDSTMQTLFNAALIVVVIIIFTSVFCIKNSFDISVMERVKEYGMLKSVGATKKQIRKSVYFEAIILGIIGIPLGILAGLLASYILIIISNYLLGAAFAEDLKLQFAFSFLAIIFATILGFVTVLLSSYRSARKACKISPIRAIRGNDEIKIKKNKIKCPKIVSKIFGIGGEISYKNLKRSKKKYRTTVISIVVCVAVFLGLTSFMNYAFKMIKLEYAANNYNLKVSYNGNKDSQLENIRALDNIKNMAEAYSRYFDLINPSQHYSKEYQKLIDNNEIYYSYSTEYEDINGEIIEKKVESINLYLVDSTYFQEYVQSLNLNYEDVANQFIFINTAFVANKENDKEFEVEKYDFGSGSQMEGFIDDKAQNINIAKVTNKRPFFISDHNVNVILIGDQKNFNDEDSYKSIYIDSKDASKTAKDLETIFKDEDVGINNYEENVKKIQFLYILIAIFLYGFITVIALIGITNIFNTITTNMNLRRREFAMLKSIGMTKNEFNRMIRLESLFYGTKSLLIGIPLGILLSYLIYYTFKDGYFVMAYQIPWLPIIITCLVVYLLILVIMKYSLNKINKQNMIETIRNENI